MEKTEIRVRPVVRHIVTRYTKSDAPGGEATLETLGEFENERYAEHVAHCVRYMAAIEPPSTTISFSSRYPLGAEVLCVGHKHIVRRVSFYDDGKVRYGLAFHGNPAGDVIEYDSDHVYPWPPQL